MRLQKRTKNKLDTNKDCSAIFENKGQNAKWTKRTKMQILKLKGLKRKGQK
jgi:hypothetical protein